MLLTVHISENMIKLEDSKDSFYLCTSADWFTVVKASCENSASRKALKCVIDQLKEDAQISPCMRIKKIEEKMEDSDIIFRIDKIFADMGMHENSKSLNKIINYLSK